MKKRGLLIGSAIYLTLTIYVWIEVYICFRQIPSDFVPSDLHMWYFGLGMFGSPAIFLLLFAFAWGIVMILKFIIDIVKKKKVADQEKTGH